MNYLDLFKNAYTYRDEFKDIYVDSEHLKTEMRFKSIDQLMGVILSLSKSQHLKIQELSSIIESQNKQIQQLKQQIQRGNIKVINRPGRNKKFISTYEVAVMLKLKWTDQAIMEHYKISKTTLWRIKQQIKEKGGIQQVLAQSVF